MDYGKRRNFKIRYEFNGKTKTRCVYSSAFENSWTHCDCIYDKELNSLNKGMHDVDPNHESRVCVGLLYELGINHALIDANGDVYWSIEDGIARWYENGELVHEEDRRAA